MAFKIIHAKKDLPNVTLAGYVNIQKPDTYDPDKPQFKFDIDIKGAKADQLASAVDNNLLAAAQELGSKPTPKRPYKRQEDGSVRFSFKIRQFKEGERPFNVWDMAMKPVVDVPNLTAGTVVNLNFAFYVSEFRNVAYIGLQPTHIQIKEAKVYEGGGAAPTFGAGEGYGAEEEGGLVPQAGGSGGSFDANDF